MKNSLLANDHLSPVWDTGGTVVQRSRFARGFARMCVVLLSLLSFNAAQAQTSLTIGTGSTTSSYFPIYTCYGYNYSQQTFLATEIVAAGATAGTPGFISSISFNPTSISASSFATYCKDWRVYMGNTSKSTFSSTSDWVPLSSLTKVFDGTVTPSGTGWFKITFPTPFYWDGSSNIVVGIDENTASYYCTASWQATSRSGTRGLLFFDDYTNPDPASPPSANYSSGVISDIKLDYSPATPCSGTPSGGSAVASATTLCPGSSAVISVTGASAGTGLTYEWESGSSSTGPWTTITGATGVNLTVTPASGTTTYYRRKIICTTPSAYSTPVAVSVGVVKTVPYSETFESVTAGNNVACATASPSFSTGSVYYYNYDYWKVINDASATYAASNHTPSGSNYLVAGYYIGTYAGSGADYWFTPGIQLFSGKTYRFSYWHRMSDYAASSYSGQTDHGMYYANAPSKSASILTAIKPDIVGTSNNAYVQNVGDFSVASSGIYYMAIKANNRSFGGYYCAASFDDINLIELPACNTATAGTFGRGGKAVASPNVICSVPGTTTLSVTSTPPFSGLTFEWESSASSTPYSFSSISTASGSSSLSYSITAGGTYYFRCKVVCSATGLTTYSDTVKVTTTPITPPYFENFESGSVGTNLPCAGSTYWGSIPSYWNLANGPYTTSAPGVKNHTPGGTNFLYAGYYLGYGTGKAEYWFTPGLALTAGKAYNVSYWYSNSGYFPSSYASYATEMGIYAGTSQTAAAMTIAAGDTTIYIDAIATPTYDKFVRGFLAPTTGTYYVGIKVNHKNYCYYGFAIDDIGVDQLPPCSAKPVAGTAVASPSLICSTGTTTVSLSGISLASDLSFQWQSSSTGAAGSWTTISGANSPAYTTPTLSSGPMYYRCIVICGAISAPNTDTSLPAKVSVGALDLPYAEDFETGVDGVNMPCAGIAGTWSSSIQYWYLRSGDYSTSYPGVKNHTPGGKKYIYSGYYNGPYYSTGDQFYWFTPALKMTAGKAYNVGFWFNGTGYSTSYNGAKIGIYAGTTQSAAGMTIRAGGLDSSINAESDNYARMNRSFVAPTTGSYYVGIKTVHTGYNYPGIVLDDINITQMPDCSGKPVAGKADATPYLICSSGTAILRLSGSTVASSIQYQWQESTAGATGPFTNVSTGSGGTTGNYTTPSLSASRWYRCIVTCGTSGQADTSAVTAVNVGAITPPYYEDFEKGIVGTNLPCAAVNGTWSTASTYQYWTLKGAPLSSSSYPAIKNHTPGGSQYLFAGYYAGSYYSGSTVYMWMSPAIKLTAGSTYEFSYWYSGSGYTGGSTNLGMYIGTTQTISGMSTAVRSELTGVNSGTYKQMIGRFVAPTSANYYLGIKVNHTTYTYSGMAIDDIGLEQLPPCTGAPTIGAITATPSMLCTPGTASFDMDMSTVSKASGLSYTWYSAPSASGPWTAASSVLTSPSWTSGTISTTTYYRMSVKCTLTGDSTMTSPIKVDVGAVTPPYIETFETVTPGTNAPCAGYTYSWGSYAYWYTYGSPLYAAGAPSMDNHTPGGSRYLSTGYYPKYYSGDYEYWFTPAIKLTAGKLYQFSFWYVRSGYAPTVTATFGAYYGTAQTKAAMTTAIGPDLTGVTTLVYKQWKGKFTPASSGNFYIGIKTGLDGYDYYGGSAIDDIGLQEIPPCSSPVVAGTIVADPAHVCSAGGSTVLDLEGSTLATGLTYEWLSSSSPTGPWVSTGGTSLPYTTDPLMTNTWFRVIVKCPASGAADTSAALRVGVGGRAIPYKEDFETTIAGQKPLCSDATVWGQYFLWNTTSAVYSPATNHTPGGKNYLIGGYYLGYYDYAYYGYTPLTDENYWFTPGLALDAAYKYQLTFWYVTGTGGNRIGVYYGTSQAAGSMTNTIFPLRNISNSSYAMADTTFKPAKSGTYYLGFKKTTASFYTYAYPGVGFDDINLNYAPCDAMPSAGTVEGTTPSGTASCVGTKTTLRDIGSTINLVPGIKYQWMRRNLAAPGTGWKTVAGATDSVLSADTLIGFEYKFAVVCGNTNDTAYSPVYQLPAHPAHPPVSISPATSPVTFCVGDTVKFNATNFTGAVYDWMRDSVVVPGWKFSDLGAVDPGTYMVKVTSALSPCPGYSNQVKLIANDPGYTVTITKPADSILCAGSSVLLTAVSSKPGVTYQWRKDNVSIPGATSATYLVTTGGYYRVMVSDGVSSCAAASRNVLMQVKPNPPAVITVPGGTTTACENEGVLLRANVGGYTYEWSRGGSPVVGLTDSAIVVKNTGSYAVKVRNADGCVSFSSSVSVNILPSPTPVIVRTTVAGVKDELSTTLSYPNYQWIRNGMDISGANAPTYNLTMKGMYKVRVTGTNNCEGESTPIEAMEDWLSLKETNMSAAIKVYPNPTTGKVTIESPVSVGLQVKDIAGKTIFSEKDAKEVDLSKYADGVYMFILTKDNEIIGQQRVTKSSK